MTPEQRKRLNAMCGDLSRQVRWPVKGPDGNWYETLLHKDDWRHIFCGLQLGDKHAQNPDDPGRFITLAASSRGLTVGDASEVIERLFAFGNSKNVYWSDPEEAALRKQYEQEAVNA